MTGGAAISRRIDAATCLTGAPAAFTRSPKSEREGEREKEREREKEKERERERGRERKSYCFNPYPLPMRYRLHSLKALRQRQRTSFILVFLIINMTYFTTYSFTLERMDYSNP